MRVWKDKNQNQDNVKNQNTEKKKRKLQVASGFEFVT